MRSKEKLTWGEDSPANLSCWALYPPDGLRVGLSEQQRRLQKHAVKQLICGGIMIFFLYFSLFFLGQSGRSSVSVFFSHLCRFFLIVKITWLVDSDYLLITAAELTFLLCLFRLQSLEYLFTFSADIDNQYFPSSCDQSQIFTDTDIEVSSCYLWSRRFFFRFLVGSFPPKETFSNTSFCLV